MQRVNEQLQEMIRKLFPASLHDEIEQTLERECGDELPLIGSQFGENSNMERVRYAVVKLSNGDEARFAIHLQNAKRDWRDVLVGAGFGNTITGHRRWAESVLTSS